MKQAIAALSAYVAAQRAVLADLKVIETFESVDTMQPISDVSQALQMARSIVGVGGTVALTFSEDDRSVVLRSVGIDDWRVEGPLEVFSAELAAGEPRGRWSTDALVAAAPTEPEDATYDLALDKVPWSTPIAAETGRSVWVGLGPSTFLDWIHRSTWMGAVKQLFAAQGALVLFHDWRGSPVTLGERLIVGDFNARAEAPPPDERWPEPADPWLVRAIDIDPEPLPEGDLQTELAGLPAAASAWLLAEEHRDGLMRPSRAGATSWTVPSTPTTTLKKATAVVALARWVAKDPNATRLAVARQVAAERLPEPLNGGPSTPTLSAAEIAYQSAVSAHVQAALRTQLELERSYQELDSKLSDVRDALGGAVDQSIVRALTASLGITVAALTVSEARGWPTVAAAAAVAAYVLFTAWWTLRTMRSDIASRFEGLQAVIEQRQLGLGTDVAKSIAHWKDGVRTRARRAQVTLTVIAVGIVIGGLALGMALHPSRAETSPQPISPATSTPTPSPGQTLGP